MAVTDRDKPVRVGIVKFASCDGCQLGFLDIGPALLDHEPPNLRVYSQLSAIHLHK